MSSVVPLTILGTGGVVTLAKVSKGEMPDPRTYIALAALWFFLAALSDLDEDLAKPVSILILATVVLSYGSEWLMNVSKSVKKG